MFTCITNVNAMFLGYNDFDGLYSHFLLNLMWQLFVWQLFMLNKNTQNVD